MLFKFSSITDIGANRTSQQDNVLVIPQLIHNNESLTNGQYYDDSNAGLFVVADGMGGGKSGDIASQLVVEGVSEYVLKHKGQLPNESYSLVNSAIYHANEKILNHLSFHPDDLSMGSTIVLGLIQDEMLNIAWVGDSRCYGLDLENNLEQLSHDHSFVQTLIDEEKISAEEAFDHPNRNIINQSLGMASVLPSFEKVELNNYRKILLCSDGLNSMLTDREIRELIIQDRSVEEINQALVDMANEKGGDDNISSILIELIPDVRSDVSTSAAVSIAAVKPVKKNIPWVLIIIGLCLMVTFVLVFQYQTSHKDQVVKPDNTEVHLINTEAIVPVEEINTPVKIDTAYANTDFLTKDKSYYIRLKVFSNKDKALNMLDALKKENNQLSYEVVRSKEGLYEICLLDFTTKQAAVEFLERAQYPDAVILLKQ